MMVSSQMLYECERCGYKTPKRSSFKAHLQRQKICMPVYSSTSIHVLIEQFIEGKNMTATIKETNEPNEPIPESTAPLSLRCTRCGRVFGTRQSKHKHMKFNRCRKTVDLAEQVEDLKTKLAEQNETIESQTALVKKQKLVIASHHKTVVQKVFDADDIGKERNMGYVYLIRPNQMDGVYKIGTTRQSISTYLKRYQDPTIIKIWYCLKPVACEDDIKMYLRAENLLMLPLKEWFASDEDPNRLISIFDRMIQSYQK